MELTDQQIERYARHIVLPEIGEEGQEKLLDSKVLVIGAGGLGSPLLLYLAAAGVGTLGVIDDDVVDYSNLQRQVVHDTSTVGQDKVASAKARIAEVNPDVQFAAYRERLVRDRALELIAGYDVVADGSDNFATRYLVNDACYFAKRTLVSAAIMRFDGQITTFKAHRRAAGDPTAHPCQRCIFPTQPEDPKQGCADVGVLGALPGTLGALQASEVIKELLGIGESLSGRLILYDSLAASFREIRIQADPACPLCGPQATLHALEDTDYGEDARTCAA
ncbi:MAG: molybdopterin-synthase adenylyltransferase MoeB [Kiloniellales bacterium]|jgi:molybdopterin/thiamine biosynthesis adenylyltransferase|nr:molybdopterin-synthase adenylyltransferase MoeB [Kiloniellales bacterium]